MYWPPALLSTIIKKYYLIFPDQKLKITYVAKSQNNVFTAVGIAYVQHGFCTLVIDMEIKSCGWKGEMGWKRQKIKIKLLEKTN